MEKSKAMDENQKLTSLKAKKLELEIKDLEKPLFFRTSFLSLVVPIVAAIATGLIGYLSNAELEKLRVQKDQLQKTIGILETDQTKQKSELEKLQKQKQQLEQTTAGLVADQQELASTVAAGLSDYMNYSIRRYDELKKSPQLFDFKTEMPLMLKHANSYWNAQKKAAVLLRKFVLKHQAVLDARQSREILLKSEQTIAQIEKIQKYTAEAFQKYVDSGSQ